MGVMSQFMVVISQFMGATPIYGGYIQIDGGYIQIYGGYIQIDGGYIQIYGGYIQIDGGYIQIYGGYIQIDGGYIQIYGDYLSYITIFLRKAQASARPLNCRGDCSRSGSFVQIYQIPWPQFLTDWKERVALALVSWTWELGRCGRCGLRRKAMIHSNGWMIGVYKRL